MTTGGPPGEHGTGSARSVRQRLTAIGPVGWALAGLTVLAVAVHGVRALFPFYIRGDLLYHWGLVGAILRGEFPPGGAYEGLPAYYPPGFHLVIAGASRLSGLDPTAATALLGWAWLPVLPITTFLLARRLTGRPAVALLAAALTVFGGGFDPSPDRNWVNSLFLTGQEAVPLYPRDLVFGLLPLAVLAFIRALEGGPRWPLWAALAGLVLGASALVQVQLLLPLPFALAATAAVSAWRRPEARRAALGALLVTGVVGATLAAPWLSFALEEIRRNGGGVALDSAENLRPALIGFWSFPIQFGLMLPFALVGAGVALLFLRRGDGPRPDGPASGPWRPSPAEGPLALVAWFAIPFALAILYRPDWPLEDALRPQRLWLLSSQPGAMLAAIGLVTGVEHFVAGRWRRPRFVLPAVFAVTLLMTVPATALTLRVLSFTWVVDAYAHLRLVADRVPDFRALVGEPGPRRVVLTYEDWSSLDWYETGTWVVAVKPPGYAKLAFDPARFTGHSQAQRRADLGAAFRGDPARLIGVADLYRADRIVLARRGDSWGTIDLTAALALPPGGSAGATLLDGNGWDAVGLAPGGRVAFDIAATGTRLDLELRFQGAVDSHPVGERRVRLVAVRTQVTATERVLAELILPPSGLDDWQVVRASVTLEPSEALAVEAVDQVALQSIRGFVAVPGLPVGWVMARETPDAVLLAKSP